MSDLCWDPNNAWTIASVAEDNILHIWEMVRKMLLMTLGTEGCEQEEQIYAQAKVEMEP